jgi:uncharacterized protein
MAPAVKGVLFKLCYGKGLIPTYGWQNMTGLRELTEVISMIGRSAVAFSGGVDSSLVARASMKAFDGDTVGIMIENPTIPSSDIDSARKVAKALEMELAIIKANVMENPDFTGNPPDRCGICRQIAMPIVIEEAERRGYPSVVDGANIDDLNDHRPGHQISTDLGIKHPLIEAGLGKKEIRKILKEEGLNVHERPSSPCLATRIPYGERITEEKLRLIDKAEEKIRSLGFHDVRARLHENSSKEFLIILEVDEPDKALERWDSILEIAGNVRIYLDPKGYRQGSMNEVSGP